MLKEWVSVCVSLEEDAGYKKAPKKAPKRNGEGHRGEGTGNGRLGSAQGETPSLVTEEDRDDQYSTVVRKKEEKTPIRVFSEYTTHHHQGRVQARPLTFSRLPGTRRRSPPAQTPAQCPKHARRVQCPKHAHRVQCPKVPVSRDNHARGRGRPGVADTAYLASRLGHSGAYLQ